MNGTVVKKDVLIDLYRKTDNFEAAKELADKPISLSVPYYLQNSAISAIRADVWDTIEDVIKSNYYAIPEADIHEMEEEYCIDLNTHFFDDLDLGLPAISKIYLEICSNLELDETDEEKEVDGIRIVEDLEWIIWQKVMDKLADDERIILCQIEDQITKAINEELDIVALKDPSRNKVVYIDPSTNIQQILDYSDEEYEEFLRRLETIISPVYDFDAYELSGLTLSEIIEEVQEQSMGEEGCY